MGGTIIIVRYYYGYYGTMGTITGTMVLWVLYAVLYSTHYEMVRGTIFIVPDYGYYTRYYIVPTMKRTCDYFHSTRLGGVEVSGDLGPVFLGTAK